MTIEAAATLEGVRQARVALRRELVEVGVPAHLVDPMQLVWSEVATNIVRHAVPRATVIRLDVQRDGGSWLLRVHDDGGTFSEIAALVDAAPTLGSRFEPLERGLGLSLMRGLTERWRYLRVDGGNRLELWFRGEAPACKPRVVIVDDDATHNELMSVFLAEDFDVRVFEDPAAALASLLERGADVVVCDIDMPGLDGIAFLRRLRRHAELELTLFVFLTGKGEEDAAPSDLLFDDFLVKPVTRKRLLAVLRRLIARSDTIRHRLGARFDAEITDALRPSLPAAIGSFEVAVRSRMASAGGGDLLLHRRRAGGDLIVLADVMGHGERAKFFAHSCAGYVAGALHSLTEDAEPAALLAALSELFIDDDLLRFTTVTLLAVELHPGGVVVLAGAGHLLPLLVDGDGARHVGANGPMPGLVRGAAYPQTRLRLEPDQRLCLMTDGMIEVRGTTADAGWAVELRRLLAAERASPIEAAADRAMAAFEREAGPVGRDDATLVLVGPAGR